MENRKKKVSKVQMSQENKENQVHIEGSFESRNREFLERKNMRIVESEVNIKFLMFDGLIYSKLSENTSTKRN